MGQHFLIATISDVSAKVITIDFQKNVTIQKIKWIKTQEVPYMSIENAANNETRFDGAVNQIVIWLAEKCNFTSVFSCSSTIFPNLCHVTIWQAVNFYFCSFEYVLSPEDATGAFENGTWNGLVGMLVRKVN